MSYHGGTSILLQIRCCKLSCTHLLCLQTYAAGLDAQKAAVCECHRAFLGQPVQVTLYSLACMYVCDIAPGQQSHFCGKVNRYFSEYQNQNANI